MIRFLFLFLCFSLAHANTIIINQSSGEAGSDSIMIELSLDNQVPVRAIQFNLHDHPDVLQVLGDLHKTERTSAFQIAANEVDGVLSVLAFVMDADSSIAPGNGKILGIDYRVSDQASINQTVELLLENVQLLDVNNNPLEHTVVNGTFLVTHVNRLNTTLREFCLAQNYPNPFNPSTLIRFTIEKRDEVSLTIYNLKGQTVRRLVQQTMRPGAFQAEWDGRDDLGRAVPAGIYLYTLKTSEYRQTRRLTVLK
ncbi:T9SS type A sorting domain-containing protein [candidate division KSB1 bacterium]|nr:T9SS type A sorting domain-containing protein [candidate division KSB1 bacterium]